MDKVWPFRHNGLARQVTNIDGDKSLRIVVEFFALMDTDIRK